RPDVPEGGNDVRGLALFDHGADSRLGVGLRLRLALGLLHEPRPSARAGVAVGVGTGPALSALKVPNVGPRPLGERWSRRVLGARRVLVKPVGYEPLVKRDNRRVRLAELERVSAGELVRVGRRGGQVERLTNVGRGPAQVLGVPLPRDLANRDLVNLPSAPDVVAQHAAVAGA